MSHFPETDLQRWNRFEGYLRDLANVRLSQSDSDLLQSLLRVTQHEFVDNTHQINQREVVQAMATWSVTATRVSPLLHFNPHFFAEDA